MHNTFRGFCGVKIFEEELPKNHRNFSNSKVGGFDDFVDRCPIVIENKFEKKFYGGSCRYGSNKDLLSFEKVGPKSSCFISSLRTNSTEILKVLVNKSANDIRSHDKDPHEKAACFEFKCEKDEIKVIIEGKDYDCPSLKSLKIPNFYGEIKCPNKKILCDTKYFCKFGCTDI